MRTESAELRDFYASRLGRLAEQVLVQRMIDAWGDVKGQRVAGFGYAAPLLAAFPDAERTINLVPAKAGDPRHL